MSTLQVAWNQWVAADLVRMGRSALAALEFTRHRPVDENWSNWGSLLRQESMIIRPNPRKCAGRDGLIVCAIPKAADASKQTRTVQCGAVKADYSRVRSPAPTWA